MNKKISVLAIVLSGILSTNAFSADTQVTGNKGKEASSTVTQGTINKMKNIDLPNTDSSEKLIGASNDASSADSSVGEEGWNQTPMGSDFKYEIKINGQPFKNINFEPGDKPKSKSNVRTGFLKSADIPPAVKVSDDGKFYQYRVYIEEEYKNDYEKCDPSEPLANDGHHPCECQEGKQGSCWSPSYPIVAFKGFDINEFKNKAKNWNSIEDSVIARDYFGPRTQYSKPASRAVNEKNQYTTDKQAGNTFRTYRIGVKVAAHKELDSDSKQVNPGNIHDKNAIVSSSAESPATKGVDAVLSVQSWTNGANGANGGLNPDFNYALITKKDNIENVNTVGRKVDQLSVENNNLNELKGTRQDNVLPCGMFEEVSSTPTGVSRNSGVICKEDHMRITKDYSSNSTMEQLYTYYHVALPCTIENDKTKCSGNFETEFTHDLKYRACARCDSMKSNASGAPCDLLVQQYIADCQGSATGVSDCVVNKLVNEATNKAVTKNGVPIGTYNGTLQCSDCLGNLDKLLADHADDLQS